MNLNNDDQKKIKQIFKNLDISSLYGLLKKTFWTQQEIFALVALFLLFGDFFQNKFQLFFRQKESFSDEKTLICLLQEKEKLVSILKEPENFINSSQFRPICLHIAHNFVLQFQNLVEEQSGIFQCVKEILDQLSSWSIFQISSENIEIKNIVKNKAKGQKNKKTSSSKSKFDRNILLKGKQSFFEKPKDFYNDEQIQLKTVSKNLFDVPHKFSTKSIVKKQTTQKHKIKKEKNIMLKVQDNNQNEDFFQKKDVQQEKNDQNIENLLHIQIQEKNQDNNQIEQNEVGNESFLNSEKKIQEEKNLNVQKEIKEPFFQQKVVLKTNQNKNLQKKKEQLNKLNQKKLKPQITKNTKKQPNITNKIINNIKIPQTENKKKEKQIESIKQENNSNINEQIITQNTEKINSIKEIKNNNYIDNNKEQIKNNTEIKIQNQDKQNNQIKVIKYYQQSEQKNKINDQNEISKQRSNSAQKNEEKEMINSQSQKFYTPNINKIQKNSKISKFDKILKKLDYVTDKYIGKFNYEKRQKRIKQNKSVQSQKKSKNNSNLEINNQLKIDKNIEQAQIQEKTNQQELIKNNISQTPSKIQEQIGKIKKQNTKEKPIENIIQEEINLQNVVNELILNQEEKNQKQITIIQPEILISQKSTRSKQNQKKKIYNKKERRSLNIKELIKKKDNHKNLFKSINKKSEDLYKKNQNSDKQNLENSNGKKIRGCGQIQKNFVSKSAKQNEKRIDNNSLIQKLISKNKIQNSNTKSKVKEFIEDTNKLKIYQKQKESKIDSLEQNLQDEKQKIAQLKQETGKLKSQLNRQMKKEIERENKEKEKDYLQIQKENVNQKVRKKIRI